MRTDVCMQRQKEESS